MTIGVVLLLGISVILTVLYNGVVRSRTEIEALSQRIDDVLTGQYDLVATLAEHSKLTISDINELYVKNKRIIREEFHHEMQSFVKNYKVENDIERGIVADYELSEQMLAKHKDVYNKYVDIYNTKLSIFPNSIIAKMMKAKQRKYFEAE